MSDGDSLTHQPTHFEVREEASRLRVDGGLPRQVMVDAVLQLNLFACDLPSYLDSRAQSSPVIVLLVKQQALAKQQQPLYFISISSLWKLFK